MFIFNQKNWLKIFGSNTEKKRKVMELIVREMFVHQSSVKVVRKPLQQQQQKIQNTQKPAIVPITMPTMAPTERGLPESSATLL